MDSTVVRLLIIKEIDLKNPFGMNTKEFQNQLEDAANELFAHASPLVLHSTEHVISYIAINDADETQFIASFVDLRVEAKAIQSTYVFCSTAIVGEGNVFIDLKKRVRQVLNLLGIFAKNPNSHYRLMDKVSVHGIDYLMVSNVKQLLMFPTSYASSLKSKILIGYF